MSIGCPVISNQRRNAGEHGFSLLEATISLAIVALALSALYEVVENCLAARRTARDVAFVTAAADRVFAGLGILYPLNEGRQSLTNADGTEMTIEIRLLETGKGAVVKSNLALFEIDVSFKKAQGAAPVWRFHTIRVAPSGLTPG